MKNRAWLLTILLLMTLVLAACGDDDGDSDNGDAQAAAATNTPTDVPATNTSTPSPEPPTATPSPTATLAPPDPAAAFVDDFTLGLGTLRGAALSPDGETVAIATNDTLRFYAADDLSAPVLEIAATDAEYRYMAFRPDGSELVVSKDNDALDFLNPADGTVMRTQANAHTNTPGYFAFSPDGTRMLSGERLGMGGNLPNNIVLWNFENGAFGGLETSGYLPFGMAFNPDGSLVAFNNSEEELYVFDTATNSQVTLISYAETGGSLRLAFSEDGTKLYAFGSRIRGAYDTETWEFIDTITYDMPPNSNTLSVGDIALANGIIYLSAQGRILGWDVEAGGEPVVQLRANFSGTVTDIDVATDGSRLLARNPEGNKVVLFDLTGEEAVVMGEVVGFSGRVENLRYNAANNLLLSEHIDQVVNLWDLSTSPPSLVISNLRQGLSGYGATVAPFGDTLYWWDGNSTIERYDVTTGAEQERFRSTSNDFLFDIEATAGGEYIVNNARPDSLAIRMYDGSTGEIVAEVPRPEEGSFNLSLSLDGRVLVHEVFGEDMIRVYDVETLEERFTVDQYGVVLSAAVSPDGSQIVVRVGESANNLLIAVLDATSGELLYELPDLPLISNVSYSLDSSLIAMSAGRNNDTVLVIDAATGEELMRTSVGEDNAFSVTFNADVSLIYVGGLNGKIRALETEFSIEAPTFDVISLEPIAVDETE